MQRERIELLNELIHELYEHMNDQSVRWFGEEASNNLTIFALGLGGETGEVLDIVKKISRGSLTLEETLNVFLVDDETTELITKNSIPVELIDVMYYWVHLIGMLRVNVAEVFLAKDEYNERRFGDGLVQSPGGPID